jgi:Mg2+ and Co2+ transporter CorA
MVGMLDTIGGDVELLRASVQRMTENPESFGDLQVVEVNRRRDVVRQFTAKLGRCRTDLTDWQRLKADRTQALQLAAARGASAARGGPGGGPSDPGSSYVGDMVEQQREQQAALRADQDQALVRIHAGIETATDKARRIDAKLDEQHKKLTAVDQAMDSVNDKLKKVTRSVNKLIDESSDTSKYICIGVLIFILVLLLAYLFGGSSSSGSSSS